MHSTVCPFCGVASGPHETQESCIRALQEEIARVRALVDVKPQTNEGDGRRPREEHHA
jgi:hypothetical protein